MPICAICTITLVLFVTNLCTHTAEITRRSPQNLPFVKSCKCADAKARSAVQKVEKYPYRHFRPVKECTSIFLKKAVAVGAQIWYNYNSNICDERKMIYDKICTRGKSGGFGGCGGGNSTSSNAAGSSSSSANGSGSSNNSTGNPNTGVKSTLGVSAVLIAAAAVCVRKNKNR